MNVNLFCIYPTKYMKQQTQNLQWIVPVSGLELLFISMYERNTFVSSFGIIL